MVYIEHGIEELTTTHGTYSGAFRVYIIEYMYHTGTLLRQTTVHFNIPCMSTIKIWEQIHYEKGKEALYEENRDRPNRMVAKNLVNQKKILEPNDALLAEIEYLRMENEYLKKLIALVKKREKSSKTIK